MEELGNENDKVVIVNADLMGTCRNSSFVDSFPNRSFNVGIAEQNMVSFAAGLANEGYIPYVFSMAPFISMRACEQCRTDVAYSNLKVRLVATYAGLSGGISGATHWSIEDCGIMSSIPNMTVIEPCDPIQAKKILHKSMNFDGPIYIRSSVEPVKSIYSDNTDIEIGRAIECRSGKDGTFICSGNIVHFAIEASEFIKENYNKEIAVYDMHTIKPIDEDCIKSVAKSKNIVVAQDHNIIGGLGSAVAMVIAKNNLDVNFRVLGITDEFVPMAHASYLYNCFGYDTDGLIKTMIELINN